MINDRSQSCSGQGRPKRRPNDGRYPKGHSCRGTLLDLGLKQAYTYRYMDVV